MPLLPFLIKYTNVIVKTDRGKLRDFIIRWNNDNVIDSFCTFKEMYTFNL